MLRSLMSGVSGVKGHQVSLDVVGNNIANVNTAGYKRSSITFQDLLYQNTSGTAAPNDQRGGVNAKQVGLGMQVSAIETLHTQGTTEYTGNRTDLAVQGDGYFVVMDGNGKLYTRAGNFTLDAKSNLVQAGTGYRLQGYEVVRDPIDPLEFNQGSTLKDINIPTGQKMEARQTTVVGYRCNLDSRAGTYLPMGLTANNFSTTATLNNQHYKVTMQEGSSADGFMTLNIGGEMLTLKMTGVDEASGRPTLASETPFEIDGSVYTVAFDSATGNLNLTNIDPSNPDEWTLNLEEQMDYQTLTITDGANRYSYLAEFTDITTAGQEGDKTLRLWGEDYKGDMAMFQYTVQMNDDGTFGIPGTAVDGITRLGGFAGGAFVTISNATGNQGVQLTSTVEIVDASQITDRVGIKPTIVQNVGIGGKAYDVTITEGNPNSGYATLKFVDRADPNNTGTLQLNYNGLNATGSVQLAAASTFVLDGKTYEGVYTVAGATDATGSLVLNDVTDPLNPVHNVWPYALGGLIKMGNETVGVGPLAGFGSRVRTEFDSLGSGDYRMTLLGNNPSHVLEVQTYNFRKNMGVVPATTNVMVGSTEYAVTPTEGTTANNFMTLTFAGPGAPAAVNFSMNGLDSSGRLKIAATGTITLGTQTYNLNTVPYDPATGLLTFTSTTPPGQDFTYDVGKYVNFQTVADSNNNRYVVDYDEAGSGAFTMKVWNPGTTVGQILPGTFTATPGEITVAAAAVPVAPGSLQFGVDVGATGATTHLFRDDGLGGFQVSTDAGATWPAAAGSIDYTTGAITGLEYAAGTPVPAGTAVTSWSSLSGGNSYAQIQNFAAGNLPVNPSSAPIVPGSLSFTAGGFDFQDNGAGGFEYDNAGVWTPVGAGTINYQTGAITGLNQGGAIAGPVTNWTATRITPQTNTFSVPVTKGNEQALATVNQRIANVHNTKIDVFDSLGNPYTLEVSWEKQDNGVWRWRAWLPDSTITLGNNTGLLRFGPDGKLDTSDTGMYNPTPEITVQFDEIGARESTIKLDFSGQSFKKELLDGVTQYGSEFTTKGYYQDGYSMGVLTDFATAQDGTINGIYSNGQNIPLYRVALALFANTAGLLKNGNTAFMESNNSGIAQIGSPLQGGAGSVVGSSLEMSNVDLTEEFTKLIISQRGFQANARIITTSDQVLEELINIKR